MRPGVLVVDDSLTVRMDLAEAFQEFGFEVAPAATLAAARQALCTRPFALVILDLQLPDGDGLDLLRELRSIPATSQIPVMLLSTEAEVRDRVRGLTTGADEYVGKPYERAYVLTRGSELARHQEAPASTRQRILIVDDSATFREAMREALEAAGYEVSAAAGGEEGLRLAAEPPPPLAAVVDGQLPDIDGAEVVRRMKADPVLRHVPTVLLTAAEGREDELRGLESGADAYFRKGDGFDVILARLAALLRAGLATPPASEDAAQMPKILAVDDSLTYLEELSSHLREEGYHVVQARSGEQALELLAVEAVDCVLLDFVMPGLSGLETCRRVKRSPHWRNLPLLMLTARDDREALLQALGAGADDYVVKSGDFDILKERLRAQLRRKQFEEENRRLREDLLRREMAAVEAVAARELAETRARLLANLERKNEELARARDVAETASRVKGEFLANMSHEIRTPLNGILGMAEILLGTSVDDEQRECLRIVQRSAQSLLQVIGDILDFSKVEAGRLELESIPFSVAETLTDALKTLAARADSKGLDLVLRCHPGVPEMVQGDPGRLRQVLLNLVGNAIKFSEYGEIVLECAVASGTEEDVELHLSVTDTGIGIPPEKQEAIFEAFTQADNSITRQYGGTGLGLTISARLVGMMGGRIWVESAMGRGSTFHFTMRFGRAAAAEPGQVTLDATQILVAHSNLSHGVALHEMLQASGLRPTVRDSEPGTWTALEGARAAGAPFRVVLIDVGLPPRGGFPLAARIQEQLGTDAPPILMMLRAVGRPGDAARCREMGIAGTLSHPIQPSDLRAALRSALGVAAAPARVVEAPRAPARPLRILLAEDSPLNQAVARKMLERAGHEVTLAENGRQALAALDQQTFDVVLMDVQMPEMGGFEATAAIREKERADKAHTPIVALTAHAMKGDRERCLAAGMDAYASKPFQSEALLAAIEDALAAARGAAPAAVPRAPGVPAWRPDQAMLRAGGDAATLSELVGLFLGDLSAMMTEIRGAVDRKDADALERAAHRLRGSASFFDARPVVDAAAELEDLAGKGELEGVEERCRELEGRAERLRQALSEPLEDTA
jgi:CheY-like chemotaxis protein/HPt (histidine-containing phosphotransfer) domain-containing protein